jgi:hypothetical protein
LAGFAAAIDVGGTRKGPIFIATQKSFHLAIVSLDLAEICGGNVNRSHFPFVQLTKQLACGKINERHARHRAVGKNS